MIGLDTNVLIRYLTQDDPILSPKATKFIERELSEENPGFVTVVTIAEVAWVLESCYSRSPDELACDIERVLGAETLIVEREQHVFNAMMLLRRGLAEFSDALIGLLALRAGCSHTVTFDRKAAKLAGFERLA